MQKTIRLLAVLLAAQLLLALGLGSTAPELAAHPADTPLLALTDSTVDRIALTGSDGASVVLSKTADGWQLPDLGGFPADEERVEGLLERLRELTAGPPVATSASARSRFKVADEAFERRIALASGDDTLATLYLGTSPAMRQTHARRGGEDAIRVVRLATYEVPASAAEWQDKEVLQFAEDDIATIGIGKLTLRRVQQAAPAAAAGDEAATATVWQAADGGLPVDQEAAALLASKLAHLRIGSVLGRESKPEYGLEQPLLTLRVGRRDGDTVEYRLGKLKDGDDHVLKVSSRPEYFKLPGYTADGLLEAAARDALIADQAGKEQGEAEDTAKTS